jgi:hypothetical protein
MRTTEPVSLWTCSGGDAIGTNLSTRGAASFWSDNAPTCSPRPVINPTGMAGEDPSAALGRPSVRFVESLALPNPICRRLHGLVILEP